MFELDIARRHVVSNRRGTAFTLISVAIAVGIIIMSLGLTEGVRMQIVQDTIDKNPHLIINPKNGENYITMYRTISRLIADVSWIGSGFSKIGWPGSCPVHE